MVKVTKWSRTKKKADRANYKAEIKALKYGIVNNVMFVMKELFKFDKLMFLCIFLFAFGFYFSNLLSVYISKYVVELAAAGFGDKRLILICLGILVGISISAFIAESAGNYKGFIGFRKFNDHLCGKIMHKSLTTDYENCESSDKADKLNKAVNALWVAAMNTPVNVRGSIRHILEFFTYSAILSVLDIRLVPVIVIPAALGYFCERHKMFWVWNMADFWQKSERRISYIDKISGDFQNAKDTRIYNMQSWFNKAWKRSADERIKWYTEQDAWEFRHNIFGSIVAFIGDLAAYIYVIYLVMSGNIGPGDFVLYFDSIMRLSTAVKDWLNNFSGYQWISNNVNYIREYLEMPDKTNRGTGKNFPIGKCEIEFKNVSYKYSGAENFTIKDLSFTLHKGKKLALVGLNGAGKTTIVKLMCGLYDPTEGEIFLNGINVKNFNREEYFKLFSAVFQDIFPIAASVSENIAGSIAINKDKLCDCMKKAGIYDKINSLPEKENTKLVRGIYEDSIELSGGETQKLALAKALYKNAPVLLLDEPTAALDPITEQEMYMNYLDFSKERTCVFISHRLASTRFCDKIMLIENGEIAELGTHSELMLKGGKYAELFNIQSSYYNDENVNKEADCL